WAVGSAATGSAGCSTDDAVVGPLRGSWSERSFHWYQRTAPPAVPAISSIPTAIPSQAPAPGLLLATTAGLSAIGVSGWLHVLFASVMPVLGSPTICVPRGARLGSTTELARPVCPGGGTVTAAPVAFHWSSAVM